MSGRAAGAAGMIIILSLPLAAALELVALQADTASSFEVILDGTWQDDT